MTIKELKTLIENLPDDALVGVHDHFGYLEEIDTCHFYEAGKGFATEQAYLQIQIPDIGEEPD